MMTRRRIGLGLITLGVLALIATIGCALLAIWTDDGRWDSTAFLSLAVGIFCVSYGSICVDKR